MSRVDRERGRRAQQRGRVAVAVALVAVAFVLSTPSYGLLGAAARPASPSGAASPSPLSPRPSSPLALPSPGPRTVGYEPMGAVYDSGNGQVFVANFGSANVTVLDGSTGDAVASIPIPDTGPYRLAYDPANGYVYVTDASGAGSDLWAIDGITDSLVGPIHVGGNPHGVVYDAANGELYVTNLYDANVSVINAGSDTVLGSIPVGDAPDAIAYDSANGYLYVANDNSNNVTVIDGATNSVVASIAVGSLFTCCADATGIAFDAANGDLYVSDDGSANVTVIDGATDAVVGSVNVGNDPADLAFSPATGYVYVPDVADDNLSVVDTSSGQVVGWVPAGPAPTDVAVDTATHQLYVTDSSSNDVTVVNDTFGTTRVQLWNTTYFGNSSCSFRAPYAPPVVTGPPNATQTWLDPDSGSANWFPFGDSQFTALLIATLYVPTTGVYGLQVTSNDGSALYVDGAFTVGSPGGWCAGAGSGSVRVPLSAGSHLLQVYHYSNNIPGSNVYLSWETPGSAAYTLIPPAAFLHGALGTSPQTYNLTARVVDSTGAPVAAANVSVGDLDETTNSSGLATFDLEAGTYVVTAAAPYHEAQTVTVSVDGNTTANLTLAFAFRYVGQIPASHLNISTVADGYVVSLLPMLDNATEQVYFDWAPVGSLAPSDGWTNFSTAILPTLIVEGAAPGSPAFPDAWYANPMNATLAPTNNSSGAFLATSTPWAAGSISINPDPPILGQPTIITVALHNPNSTGPLLISRVDFQVGGFSVGADDGWISVGNFTNVTLAPGELENLSVAWVTNVTGHHCVRIVLTYPGDPPTQQLQHNYDVLGAIPPGCGAGISAAGGNPYPTYKGVQLHLGVNFLPCTDYRSDGSCAEQSEIYVYPQSPPPGFVSGIICSIAHYLRTLGTDPYDPDTNGPPAILGVRGEPRPTSAPSGRPAAELGEDAASGAANTTIEMAPGENLPLYVVIAPAPNESGPMQVDLTESVNGSVIGGLRINLTVLPSGLSPVTFHEIGLPAGTPWGVNLSGPGGSTSYPSNNTTISVGEVNGSYSYSVGSLTGFVPVSASGAFSVDGGWQNVTVRFVPAYTLTLEESGLPTGWPWTVSLADGPTLTSHAPHLVVGVANGSSAFRVGGGSWYSASPATGSVDVTGENVSVPIAFAARPTALLSFHETGLPARTEWGIGVGTPLETTASAASTIVVSVPVSSAPLELRPPLGYAVAQLTGAAVVSQTEVNGSAGGKVTVMFGPLEHISFAISPKAAKQPYAGAAWTVSLVPKVEVGGPPAQSLTSQGASINFTLPAGAAYRFTITGPGAEYRLSPSAGSLVVPHHSSVRTVAFALLGQKVTFAESGLTHGAHWTVWLVASSSPAVAVGGNVTAAAGGRITIKLPLGNYTYLVGASNAETATPTTGTIAVTTVVGSQAIKVQFT